MITFFRKLFKRGDFMTRADKWYYSKVIKTWLWSAFAFVIIAWVGTNLVLCALTTNVKSGGDIIYEIPKDVYFISGPDFQSQYLNISNIMSVKSVTFDRYTNEINKKIAGVEGTEVVDGIMYYKVGNDLYFLSNDNIVANEDCSEMFTNYISTSAGLSSRKGILQKIVFNNFDTRNVTNMSSMFSQCYNLEEIVGLEHFNTSNVTNMRCMIYHCELLTEINVSSFDTANVTNMEWMFAGNNLLTEIDISSFYTPKVEIIGNMFRECDNLETIYASDKWTTASIKKSKCQYVFWDSPKLIGGNGTICTGEKSTSDYQYARIDKDGQIGYFTEK